jgi:predicted 2-oxoglutarate/Fe(II)-dependent dioxygenase YbiX/peroxiredoxin
MGNPLFVGDQAPWFHAAALSGNARYAFHTAAGRPILMLLMGSGAHPATAAALGVVARHRPLFDDDRAAFFGVSTDPRDVSTGRIAQSLPGVRWLLDHDGAVSRLYGSQEEIDGRTLYRPHWLLLDTTLRVAGRFAIDAGEQAVAALLRLTTEPDAYPAAPVLVVPRVLDAALCRLLIDAYAAHGGEDSGFMREENGVTVGRIDHDHKRRSDYHIRDEELRDAARARLNRFLLPQIERAFQFQATRIERWLVACYDAADGGGHFRAHRDNTTKGTAHRKFACTINLNADEYDGGDLAFPEFGQQTYRAPTGGAVIFSCSLLHEARPVTRGRRYAFLPFLYDEAGAALREANMQYVAPEIQGYRSGIGEAAA